MMFIPVLLAGWSSTIRKLVAWNREDYMEELGGSSMISYHLYSQIDQGSEFTPPGGSESWSLKADISKVELKKPWASKIQT